MMLNKTKQKVLAKECVVTRLSATASSLSGLKVPSVSMYMALPSPPPWSIGSCGTTQTLSMKIPYSNAFLRNFTSTLPDRWPQVCGTTGSSRSETLQTSLWWSPSQFHLQRTVNPTSYTLTTSAWISELYWPCRSLSSSLEPVEIWIISALLWWNSVAVVKPIGTSLAASVSNEGKSNHGSTC